MTFGHMRSAQFFIVFLLLFACAAGASAQAISGQYQGSAELEQFGKLPVSAVIRQKKDSFGGTVDTPLGTAAIIGGSLTGSDLKLTIDAGGDDIDFAGKFEKGVFTGKVVSDAYNGTFELTRTGDAPPEPDLSYILSQSREKWREDLRFMAAEVPKKHKNAFHTISREQFETAVADLDKQIPNLDDTQIVFGFARILAMIGDGHTSLYWSQIYDPVPVRLFWFGKELRVRKFGKELPQLKGARLMKIGGVAVEEIFKRSQAYIAQGETPQFVLAESAAMLSYPAFLYAIGISKTTASADFEFIGSGGKRFSIKLKTVSKDQKTDWHHSSKTVPLWLQNEDKPLSFTYLPDKQAVYVQFASYPRRKEFRKFSDGLFAFLDKTPVKKLIFDLRLNGGGDFTRGRDFFIKPLKERKDLTEKGRLFVLAGRWTFSAGMSNAADFRNEFGAILAGEPTGQRPNGYSENRVFRLPASHLEFAVSITTYQFADRDTAGLIPDKLFEPDWRSFAAGRDPALAWILDYPVVK